jgi:hypothetical protein
MRPVARGEPGKRAHGKAVALARKLVVAGALGLVGATGADAQALATRGFAEIRGDWYPQIAATDRTRFVGDLHLRLEASAALTSWLRVRGGLDARLDTYGQVERVWAIDWFDRSRTRRLLGVRELNATLRRGRVTLEAGKQFIRWGAVDAVNPTDRFAPHDYLAVVDDELLAVTAGRLAYGGERDRVELVWAPRLTPSRIPLSDKRWTVVPEVWRGLSLADGGARLPRGPQTGVRWAHVGPGYEYAVSYYDGFQHLPLLEPRLASDPAARPTVTIARRFPRLRSAGGSLAWPLARLTLKGEAAYFWAPDRDADEYLLYVIQAERQRGELWILAGYAGEIVSTTRRPAAFAPDRGLAKAFVGKASYTLDANRRVAVEAAVRATLDGVWVRGEYSHAAGAHWRTTLGATVIRGRRDDFIGQFRDNSHLSVTCRYSF